MENLKRPAESIGNTSSEIPIPESGEDLTEGRSISSPESIAQELSNTLNEEERPKDLREALGLLQSRYSDLRSLGAGLLIQGSPKGNLYVVLSWPGHTLGYEDGHILVDGSPVLKEEE